MDIAVVGIANGADLHFDWVMSGGDLASDNGLRSAVIVSLFTDRRAEPDDVLPDGSGDRRGWWGDLPLDGAPDRAAADLIGSRLWLLERAKATTKTASLAQRYCAEALQWMIEDSVAQTVTVETSWVAVGFLGIVITIARVRGANTPVEHRYDFLWANTLANPSFLPPNTTDIRFDFSDPNNFGFGRLNDVI